MPFALITPDGMVAQVADETFEVHVTLNWVDISGIVPPPEPGWTATHQGNGAWVFAPPATARIVLGSVLDTTFAGGFWNFLY